MKSITNRLAIFILTIITIALGCSETEKLGSTIVGAVGVLYEPSDDMSISLETAPSAALYFEWEPTKAEDAGLVLYEVVFDEAEGDFSTPVYKLASESNGLANHVNISHEILNKVGDYAGIGAAETGELKWTVFSSKGLNEVIAGEIRTLGITRLAGFSEKPTEVYISGLGSEGGAELSSAEIMKSVESGKFEIYTKLTADQPYFFVDATDGTPRQFYIEEGKLLEGESGGTVAKTGVYRITLNFNIGSVEFTEITDIEIYFSPTDEFLFSHDYVGDGIWKAEDQPINFKVESWGSDERYKIRMTTLISNEEVAYEWWGTPSTDNRPGPDEPLSYWFLYPVDNSQWGGKFKFADEVDGAILDVSMIFNAEGDYTHEIVKVGDQ